MRCSWVYENFCKGKAGLRKSVGAQERLARYIDEAGKIRGDGSVRWQVFMPSNRDGNRSVFRLRGLRKGCSRTLGTRHVAKPRGKTLLGWAEIRQFQVDAVSLTTRPDEPPPRHAVIEGWPSAPERQKLNAMDLASNAIWRPC